MYIYIYIYLIVNIYIYVKAIKIYPSHHLSKFKYLPEFMCKNIYIRRN